MHSSSRKSIWRWCGVLLLLLLVLLGGGLWANFRTPPRDDSTAIGEPVADPIPPEPSASPLPSGIRLTDVTAQSGVTFEHYDGSSGEKYLVETMSAGVALFDYHGDGLIDIYFLNGAPLPPVEGPPRSNALYRNEGGMRFRDITDQAGVGDLGFALGVTVGDYNNDGFPDLFVNNFGPNVLYRNNGDGTFTEVTQEAGVAGGNMVGAGAAMLDIDGNGLVDLYVANYVHFDFDNHVRRTIDGFPCYPSPLDFEPVADVLFRNNGDGTFTDISKEAGIAGVAGTSMGIVCADFNNNGATDIFVANDVHPNFLFENDGAGRFREVGLSRGVAYNFEGAVNGNMGVDVADFNHNGWLDLFTTTFAREMPVLYQNLGYGVFEDATLATGSGSRAMPHVNWGTGFADFNNDGNRDLFIAHGHLDQNVHLWSIGTTFKVRNQLLMNTGDGKFVDVSDRCGDGLEVVESSRGTGFDDLNNDGNLDVVVLNSQAPPTILRNDTRNGNHWLQIRLRGIQSNRDGIGAQVRVTAGGKTQLQQVHSGRGYQSHHGSRLHFGLGHSDHVDRIEIRWLGGGTDVIENIRADRLISVIEGGSLVEQHYVAESLRDSDVRLSETDPVKHAQLHQHPVSQAGPDVQP